MNSNRRYLVVMALFGVSTILCPTFAAEVIPGPVLAADYYCPDQPVAGQLTLVGSETMSQLAALWYHRFEQIHPQVQLQIQSGGSELVIPTLMQDPTTIGMMSRPLAEDERQRIEQQLGMRLIGIDVGYDVLAVVVHPQNPVAAFSREQGSRLLARSGEQEAPTWGKLGVGGEWTALPISMHGYSEQSGTRTFLRQFLLGGTEGRTVDQHSSHAALLDAVSKDRGGVGIVSLSRVRPDKVRVVPVVGPDGSLVSVTDERALAEGRYPLIRRLTLIIPVKEQALRDPLRMEFIKYVLSREGQADVAKDGFLPLHPNDLIMQHDRLGWNTEK